MKGAGGSFSGRKPLNLAAEDEESILRSYRKTSCYTLRVSHASNVGRRIRGEQDFYLCGESLELDLLPPGCHQNLVRDIYRSLPRKP